MLHINDDIAIPDWELTESFMRASGPGGQNVNKVSVRGRHLAIAAAARQKPPAPFGRAALDHRRRAGVAM